MASKFDAVIATAEILLFTYILLDVYASVFVDRNDVVASPEESFLGLNATSEDSEIAGIGKFAVAEYNRFSGGGLEFRRVVKSMFAQSTYMLLIEAADGVSSDSKQYAAVVMARGDEISLAAFQEYDDPNISI